MTIRIWLDDLRVPVDHDWVSVDTLEETDAFFDAQKSAPEDQDIWVWAKTSASCIAILEQFQKREIEYKEISFDHDLGGDDTSRPVMYWIIENEFFPTDVVYIHTANPIGNEYLTGMAKRYMPDHIRVR
jgi:hypothetical protein